MIKSKKLAGRYRHGRKKRLYLAELSLVRGQDYKICNPLQGFWYIYWCGESLESSPNQMWLKEDLQGGLSR